MNWKTKQRQIQEDGHVAKDWNNKTSVALVYPNTYEIGMGNMAVHLIYRMLNDCPNIVCERAFLPDKNDIKELYRTSGQILSIESASPLSKFNVVSFSISFENDYLNILPILNLSGIPHRSDRRNKFSPLLIAGGAAVSLNPFPVSKIFDAIVLGEIECFIDDLIPLLSSGMAKSDLLLELSKIDGIFVPEHHKGYTLEDIHKKIRRAKTLDEWPVQTEIYTKKTKFGNMHLMELERGCNHSCLFCATPAIYGKTRFRGKDSILEMIETGLKHRNKFGLIGAQILAHPDFTEIAEFILSRKAIFSPSSVRIEDIDETRSELLVRAGHKKIAFGIEAGNFKLRRKIGKSITDEQILGAISTLCKSGVSEFKLYFMIGLPDENDDDILSIAALANRIYDETKHLSSSKKGISLNLTATSFIPKPCTPFSSKIFAGETALKAKSGLLRSLFRNKRHISIQFDNLNEAETEAKLSTGNDEVLEFLEKTFKESLSD